MSVYILSPNELYHHGILGQKWGVRRYQNEDGTLTEAGKKRLQREINDNARRKKENRVPEDKLADPDRWVQEDISNAKDVATGGKNIFEAGKEIERMTRKKTTNNVDLSNMSNDDLRQAINRMNLERQYRDLTAKPETISKGRKVVQGILEYGGATLGIVGTSLGIALSVQKLKG